MEKYLSHHEYTRIERVLKTNYEGLRRLDEQIYVPQYGFKDINDYYCSISLNYKNRLSKIRIPTLALSSLDDNMCHYNYTPRQSDCGGKGSMVISAETRAGCHCCHISGKGLFGVTQWFPRPFVEFLDFIQSERLNAKRSKNVTSSGNSPAITSDFYLTG